MPCLCPLDAWPAPPGAPDRRPVFSPMRSYQGAKAFSLPCGQCVGCRLDKREAWAVRILHEASLYEANSFVTWTYADEHLPRDLSLSVRTMQLTMKRLRHSVGSCRNVTCGEYGEANKRPHYHSILFGHDFRQDRFPWKKTGTGEVLYRSPTLEKVWPYGHVLVGDVTRQSAGYVAGYVRKKVTGKGAVESLRRAVANEDGEIFEWSVRPEFLVMSRRPGIGAGWFERFACDAFPSDFLIVEGKRVSVPRYYLDKLAEAEKLAVVAKRKAKALPHKANNTERRLMERHELAGLRMRQLVRPLDRES